MQTVGIALGSGGVRGLAHIAVLETLDSLGANVVAVSGTSIGAIIGSLYASGKSGSEIREIIQSLLKMPRTLREAFVARRPFGWLDLLGVDFGRGHLLNASAFVSEFTEIIGVETFEELKIPTRLVAADFWNRKEVIIDSGPIVPAVRASFGLPAIFEPVVINDTVLVDGGCVNPVPFDIIRERCDILIAVDVLGQRTPGQDPRPSYIDAIFNTVQIAEKAIVAEKLKTSAPEIYIEPVIEGVKILEFGKADEIYQQAQAECEHLKAELSALLNQKGV